ncbi:phospho-N-acetylmuramoyl-pentapeptide-transferase [Microlunatus endophyticus]|uniref:Phospho-N-acetylmuramoyl-pentapeptide-transferase n=1 Tax=Microlunatus endophyticus TaxID=1716077 RepID=A0A917SE82_9ACTN|nr:phospho-N-acetylmuramoyl-pentapeptide-transferase [Microlunatus endophyticus]GGL76047.1 phospho-N-acetylmuramoyl-pentapeptide-transferase [Microlunatus endophyticus]
MIAIAISGILALFGSLFGTKIAVGAFSRRGYGQPFRDGTPDTHQIKRGTPTMGGLVIIASVDFGYLVAQLITMTVPSLSALLVLFLINGLAVVGFLDDYLKTVQQHSKGLHPWAKIGGQTLIGVAFAVLALEFPDSRGLTPASPFISFLRNIPPELPMVVAVIWIVLVIIGASNGVNLTDGLDGLAAGACAMIFGAYALINIWQYNQSCARVLSAGPNCYEVRDPYDLAAVALALAGGCFGFLWWNAKPAKIIMGDTGALSLGGGLAAFAVFSRTELLLILLGGLMVIEVGSLILQTSYFKATRRLTGTPKRLFKNSPLHNHLEMLGWAEVTIVMRFWIIAGLCVAAGLGIFYAEWLVR